MAANRAISGAQARIYLNDTFIGWASSVSVQENIQNVRVDVLGNIDSEEIEPVGRTVSMTCEVVRIKRKPIESYNAWPEGGTVAVVNFPALRFVIYNDVDDEPIAVVKGAKPESKSWRIGAREVVTQNVTYQALSLDDNPDPN